MLKVDSLGETLLFTQSKSDKNWPNQPIKFVKEKRVTNLITEISLEKAQKIWTGDAKCQTATLKSRVIFTTRGSGFNVWIVVTVLIVVYFNSWKAYVTGGRESTFVLRQRILPNSFVQTVRFYSVSPRLSIKKLSIGMISRPAGFSPGDPPHNFKN